MASMVVTWWIACCFFWPVFCALTKFLSLAAVALYLRHFQELRKENAKATDALSRVETVVQEKVTQVKV